MVLVAHHIQANFSLMKFLCIFSEFCHKEPFLNHVEIFLDILTTSSPFVDTFDKYIKVVNWLTPTLLNCPRGLSGFPKISLALPAESSLNSWPF